MPEPENSDGSNARPDKDFDIQLDEASYEDIEATSDSTDLEDELTAEESVPDNEAGEYEKTKKAKRAKKPRTKTRKVIDAIIIVLMIALVTFSGLMILSSLGVINLDNSPLGKAKDEISKQIEKHTPDEMKFHGLDSKVIDNSKHGDGSDSSKRIVYTDPNDPNAMWRTTGDDGSVLGYAPLPDNEFKNQKCNMNPRNEVKAANSSWSAPSVGSSNVPVQVSGHDGALAIPNAPLGVQYAQDSQLGDKEGAILQAGHVNYTESPFVLSPWGYLHRINACDRIYETAADGKSYEFVVTDLYTVPQWDLPNHKELFRRDGDLALYMVTCSGPYQGDAGGNWVLGGYTYNLVVKAVPVHA